MKIFLSIFFAFYTSITYAGVSNLVSPGEVTSAHEKIETQCELCHKKFDKKAQTELCLSCHKEIKVDYRNPQKYHSRFSKRECKECHVEHKGANMNIAAFNQDTFNHDNTMFSLKGKHKVLKCASCHQKKTFRMKTMSCNGCHAKIDPHKAKLGEQCQDCHNETNWKQTTFNHNTTKFKLDGAHEKAECRDCHSDKTFASSGTECVSCHIKKDVHKGKLGPRCEQCHTVNTWKPKTDMVFDHSKTRFLLKGKHADIQCKACHLGLDYKKALSMNCVGCHATKNPHSQKIGDKCGECHNESSWLVSGSKSNFDHSTTRFLLKGKHLRIKCESCHKNGVKEKLGLFCISCHKKDDTHKGTVGSKCETCHSEEKWTPSIFNHDSTKYPLLGKHSKISCAACHNNKFQPITQKCAQCHIDPHKSGMGSKCESCHTEKGWSAIIFKHSKMETRFPLTGKHVTLFCAACHNAKMNHRKGNQCVDCHLKDDKHKTPGWNDCVRCHTTETWGGKDFNHNTTRFALLGRHALLKCESCHKTIDWKKIKTACIGCHKKEDKHQMKGWENCGTCHSSRGWKLWDFNHSGVGFDLTKQHAKVPCSDCHQKEKPTAKHCVSCHRVDDVHFGAFGEQCDRCHEGNSWEKIKKVK